MNKESSNLARISTIIAVSVIVLGAYFVLTTPSTDKKKYKTESESAENDVEIGGDFELTNLDGQKENTSIFNQKYKLVYFGFTYCPDICPYALDVLSRTLVILDKYNIDVVPIFVTVDPKRDTPEVLKPYLKHFNEKIVGYTGSDEEIKKAADLYKVYYAISPRHDAPAKDYLVDHSSFFYFVGPDSKYIKHFSSSSEPMEIAEFIRQSINADNLDKNHKK
jgi:protein SCO1